MIISSLDLVDKLEEAKEMIKELSKIEAIIKSHEKISAALTCLWCRIKVMPEMLYKIENMILDENKRIPIWIRRIINSYYVPNIEHLMKLNNNSLLILNAYIYNMYNSYNIISVIHNTFVLLKDITETIYEDTTWNKVCDLRKLVYTILVTPTYVRPTLSSNGIYK
jgi:hypothetical protein